jgi:hypothetical protein
MKLVLARIEEDPEGLGAEEEDPMREAGAVIEKGPCSSRFIKALRVHSRLSQVDKYQSRKGGRRKEEGMGDQKVKSSTSPEVFSTMPVMYLTFSEAKKTRAWATS